MAGKVFFYILRFYRIVSVKPDSPQCSQWTLSPLSVQSESCCHTMYTVKPVSTKWSQWTLSVALNGNSEIMLHALSVHSESCCCWSVFTVDSNKKIYFFVCCRTYQKDSIFSFHNVYSKPVAPPWSVNPVAPQCSHWTLSPLSIHIEPGRPSVFTVNHVAPQCLQWIISPLSVYSEPCRPSVITVNHVAP